MLDDPKKERARRSAALRWQAEASQTLSRIEELFPDAPAGMAYFRELHRRAFGGGAPPAGDAPVVATTCVQAPLELIRAAGARPLRMCSGAHAFEPAGADFLPAKGCPLVRATLGSFALRSFPSGAEPRLIVNVSSCDQKRKAGEALEELGYRVHALELPPAKGTEEAREYWRQSVARLAQALQGATGVRITRGRLAQAIREVASAQRAFRRLAEARRAEPSKLSGTEAFLVANAFFFDDIARWTAAVERLAGELEARRAPASAKPRPRILFTGSPPIFPNLKLPLLIEQAGGDVVVDEVCSSNRLLSDSVHFDEAGLYDMIPAVADRYLKPCTCPVFTSGEDRRRRVLELARSFAVDGAVYQVFSGCHPYDMEQRGVRAALEKAGVPALFVETDYSPDDAGQLSTRVEAFLESVGARRAAGRGPRGGAPGTAPLSQGGAA